MRLIVGRLLAAAERQLGETGFLLGDRPTAVDCVVLGGLRAHTNMDPDPKRTVAEYPRVLAWAEEGARRLLELDGTVQESGSVLFDGLETQPCWSSS